MGTAFFFFLLDVGDCLTRKRERELGPQKKAALRDMGPLHASKAHTHRQDEGKLMRMLPVLPCVSFLQCQTKKATLMLNPTQATSLGLTARSVPPTSSIHTMYSSILRTRRSKGKQALLCSRDWKRPSGSIRVVRNDMHSK